MSTLKTMQPLISRFTENKLFAVLLIASLIAALFYTGLDMSLYSTCFVVLSLCFALVMWQRFKNPVSISLNPVFISITLLLFWYAVTIFTSDITYLSLHSFFSLGSIYIIFILYTLIENKDEVWKTIWPLLLLIVFIWAVWGLVQYYYLRIATNASFLNRNTLAALINLALIPASGYFLLDEKLRGWKIINNKFFSLILFILFLTTFIITSRGGSLSLAFGFILLFALLWQHVKKANFIKLFSIMLIAFLFAHFSPVLFHTSLADFSERMISLTDVSRAGNPRFIIWNSLLPLFKEAPWYGLGLGSLWIYWAPHRPANDQSAGFFAHNDYMQMTLEAGYPGILLLVVLFIFIVVGLVRTLKSTQLALLPRVEVVSLFAALATYAAHSMFTYNFYVLPLLIIAGLYLARFSQLAFTTCKNVKVLPALKTYFVPATYIISLGGIVIILCSYFIAATLSIDYNNKANQLMLQNKYDEADANYVKAQRLAPLVDNPFFSHANMLMNAAFKLKQAGKDKDAEDLFLLAHRKLDHAEKLNPLRHQIFHIRGILFINHHQQQKAKLQFEKALSLAPRYLHSRIQLATLLHKEKDLAGAIKVLHKGLFYKYPAGREVVDYLTIYSQYAKEAGDEKFSRHLENEVRRVFSFKPR